MTDRHIAIGDLSLRLSLVADALGIPAATLERLASGEWVAVPKLLPINMNSPVRFKPTQRAKERFRKNREEMQARFPNHPFRHEIPLDADGFHQEALWWTMAFLAPDCVAGGQATEDGDIVLEVSDERFAAATEAGSHDD